MPKPGDELESIEMQLLLEAVARHYGFDFRNYSPASLKRRIADFVKAERLTTVSGLQEKVLHDRGCMERMLLVLCQCVRDVPRSGFFCVPPTGGAVAAHLSVHPHLVCGVFNGRGGLLRYLAARRGCMTAAGFMPPT